MSNSTCIKILDNPILNKTNIFDILNEESSEDSLNNTSSVTINNFEKDNFTPSMAIDDYVDNQSSTKILNSSQENDIPKNIIIPQYVGSKINNIYIDILKNKEAGNFSTQVTNSLPKCIPISKQTITCKFCTHNKLCTGCTDIKEKRFYRDFKHKYYQFDYQFEMHLDILFQQSIELEECKLRRMYLAKLLAITMSTKLNYCSFFLIFLLLSISCLFDRSHELMDLLRGVDNLLFGHFNAKPPKVASNYNDHTNPYFLNKNSYYKNSTDPNFVNKISNYNAHDDPNFISKVKSLN